jgi:hypothetical protein
MPDEPVGEAKAVEVFEVTHFCDSVGRNLTRLTPRSGPVRYRGKVILAGPRPLEIDFGIEAATDDEALARFDGRAKEEAEKFATEMRKAALAAGTPMIDQFRARRNRVFGGNGG